MLRTSNYILIGLFQVVSALLVAQDIKQVPGQYALFRYRQADGNLYAIGVLPDNSKYLAQIDPAFGKTVSTYPFTQVSGPMEFSQNEDALYYSISDSIFRFDMNNKIIDQRFRHQLTGNQTIIAIQILPIPGQHGSIVVLWRNINTSTNTLAIYDNGVRRPDIVSAVYGFTNTAISDNGNYIFGYNGASTASTIVRFRVVSSGIQLMPSKYRYIKEFSSGLQCIGSRIYGSDGTIIKITQDTALSLIGRLQTHVNGSAVQGGVLNFGENSDTLYFLFGHGTMAYLFAFHRYNFQILYQQELVDMNPKGYVKSIVPLDKPENIAFMVGGQLFISRNCTSALPSPPEIAPVTQYHCQGDTLYLVAPGNFDADRYFWPDGSRSKVYSIFPAASRQISYQVADDNGCLSPPSPVVNLQLATKPPTPSIKGEGTPVVCEGGGYATIYALPPNNLPASAFEYKWSGGHTGQRIQVDTPGNYTCRLVSKQGCTGENAPQFNVASSQLTQPGKPGLVIVGGDGDEQVCASDSAEIQAPAGFATYYWSDGLVELDNARPVAKSQSFQVVVGNTAGCRSESSDEIVVQFFDKPEKPQVIKVLNVLASSATVGNQWFRDDKPIPGANEQYLIAAQPGYYTVRVMLSPDCPSEMSDPVLF